MDLPRVYRDSGSLGWHGPGGALQLLLQCCGFQMYFFVAIIAIIATTDCTEYCLMSSYHSYPCVHVFIESDSRVFERDSLDLGENHYHVEH